MRKPIKDQRSLAAWKASTAHKTLLEYAANLARSVHAKTLTPTTHPTTHNATNQPHAKTEPSKLDTNPQAIDLICQALAALHTLLEQTPPLAQPMRFGNTAFRTWHAAMASAAPELMRRLVASATSPVAADIVDELVTYYTGSFGSTARIDYGTGHELSFFIWLHGLEALGLWGSASHAALVLRVFNDYVLLMRRLQTTYWLEPAGSHGVWGLDDYQFLPFLFGAAQLEGHATISPSSIHDEQLLAVESRDYMYLAAVRFIHQVKKGPFHEHSPYLNDISQLGSWRSVAAGLLRMYEGEVLGKLPVVQHLEFGSLFAWDCEFDD